MYVYVWKNLYTKHIFEVGAALRIILLIIILVIKRRFLSSRGENKARRSRFFLLLSFSFFGRIHYSKKLVSEPFVQRLKFFMCGWVEAEKNLSLSLSVVKQSKAKQKAAAAAKDSHPKVGRVGGRRRSVATLIAFWLATAGREGRTSHWAEHSLDRRMPANEERSSVKRCIRLIHTHTHIYTHTHNTSIVR